MLNLEYWSLSSYLKSKVKNVVSFINDFKILSEKKAIEMECESIMIGHIHTPTIEMLNTINYLNPGDFCESCSYMVETTEGNIELRYA